MVDKRIILVGGIILLFIFSSVVPLSIGLNVNQLNQKASLIKNNDEVDWWPMFHHDLKLQGYSKSKGIFSANVLWRYGEVPYIWANPMRSSPALYDGKLYQAALDPSYPLKDKSILKRMDYTFINNNFRNPVLLDDYLDNYDDSIFWHEAFVLCYNAVNGHLIWKTLLPNEYMVVSSMVVDDGRAYILAGDCLGCCETNLYCLNADNGEILWNREMYNDFYPSPIVVDGKVYMSGQNEDSYDSMCILYCLNSETGEEIYNSTIGPGGAVESPAFFNNYLYLVVTDTVSQENYSTCFYCINILDGSIIWEKYIGKLYGSAPVIYEDTVFCSSSTWPEEWPDNPEVSSDGILYCLNRYNGEEIWNFTTIGICNIWSTPAIAYDKIYLANTELTYWCTKLPNCTMFCLNPIDGNIIWNKSLEKYLWTSPAVADGKVYICAADQGEEFTDMLYCLDAISGDILWDFPMFIGVRASPVIANGILITASSHLIAFSDTVPTNNPPTVIINGSSTGIRFLKYKYTITANDLESNYINVLIEFSDNNETVKFKVSSGELISIDHRWNKVGEYFIRAMAEDENYTWSDWTVFKIAISKPRYSDTFFLNLVERFPVLDRLMNHWILINNY